MFEILVESIREHLKPVMLSSNLELFELKIAYRGDSIFILLLVDKPQGGIALEECSFLNRQLIRKIDEMNWIPGDYNVEVSSPGLDRPLATKKDFLRVLNQPARFHLSDLIEGKLEHVGVIKEVFDIEVLVETKSTQIKIPLNKINKAVLVIEDIR